VITKFVGENILNIQKLQAVLNIFPYISLLQYVSQMLTVFIVSIIIGFIADFKLQEVF